MQRRICQFIISLLESHNMMSVAILRRDGYSQASTITYANNGLTLHSACDHDSQKARNIKRSPKVSLTIDRDYKDWRTIQGLSMGVLSGQRGLIWTAQPVSCTLRRGPFHPPGSR